MRFFSIQANNAYIFPGFGLGLVISGAIRVHDDMLLAACKRTSAFSKLYNQKKKVILYHKTIQTSSV